MDWQKIKLVTIFNLILLCLNIIYFFVYFSLLNLSFSWLHVFFVTIATISFLLLYNLCRWLIWRLFCLSVLFVFYFISLINFAYYAIYHSFLDFSVRQSSQLNAVMISHLKDFWFLVPTKLLILALIVFGAIALNLYFYRRFSEGHLKLILTNPQPLELFFERKRRVREVLILLILFLLINVGAFGVSAYLYNNPRETWWDLKQQLSDLGFWGYFYTQVYAQSREEKGTANVNLSWLEETRAQYQQLARLSGTQPTAPLLPSFINRPNVVVIQLESIPAWAVENEPSTMPFLRTLMKSNLTVENFHGNSCETINAEFSTLCSFWSNSFEPVNYSHQQNQFRCLPTILREDFGYRTSFFHANVPEFWSRDVLISKWGFDDYYFTPFFRQKQDDISVFNRAAEIFATSEKPFFGYLLGFTTHSPHNDELIAYQQEKNGITIQPFAGKIDQWIVNNSELSEIDLRKYLGFLQVTDEALKTFFNKMKANNLLQNTIIIIQGDHRYYNFSGEDSGRVFNNYNRLPFVLVLPNKQRGVLQNLASQLDIAPTILNLINGLNYQPIQHFIGQSMWAKDFSPLALNKCLGQIYFVNNDLIIEGNAKSRQYRVLSSNNVLFDWSEQDWYKLVSALVEKSDAAIFNDALLK